MKHMMFNGNILEIYCLVSHAIKLATTCLSTSFEQLVASLMGISDLLQGSTYQVPHLSH